MQQATRPPELAAVPDGDTLDRDQLHADACWRCGTHRGPLVPDGHVSTESAEPGARLGWAVAACLPCARRAA